MQYDLSNIFKMPYVTIVLSWQQDNDCDICSNLENKSTMQKPYFVDSSNIQLSLELCFKREWFTKREQRN